MNTTAHSAMNASVTSGVGGDTHRQSLSFRVADQLYGVPILSVQEIRGWEKPTELPQSSDHVRGVINLRGVVVPVLDVRARFGLDLREPDAATVLIVVQLSEPRSMTVGLVVDGVSDVVELDEAAVRPPPEVCGRQALDFVRGVAPMDRQMLLLLDVAKFVGDVDVPH
jgi:purine-binding chemotaxis protein CheW